MKYQRRNDKCHDTALCWSELKLPYACPQFTLNTNLINIWYFYHPVSPWPCLSFATALNVSLAAAEFSRRRWDTKMRQTGNPLQIEFEVWEYSIGIMSVLIEDVRVSGLLVAEVKSVNKEWDRTESNFFMPWRPREQKQQLSYDFKVKLQEGDCNQNLFKLPSFGQKHNCGRS